MYLVLAWLLLQIAATVAPILNLPDWFEGLVLTLVGLGFPIALTMAWALELTPDGVRRQSASTTSGAALIIDYVLFAGMAAATIYVLMNQFDAGEPVRTVADRSVAVLPFLNLGGEDSNDSFTAGIHSELCGQLSRINSLRTISWTSMRRYRDSEKSIPEIADELDVTTILEGGVQRAGGSVRISVQLIDASADEPLWTEVYDRELTAANIFAIQSEIAQAIARQLQATLSADDLRRLDAVPTRSIDALESYFIGKQMLEDRTHQSLMAAIEYFETVVELDPNFALGWSGLADAYMLLPEYSFTFDNNLLQRRAREAVLKALALDPQLPEVRASEAWYQLRFFDWVSAERIFREALAVAPDNTNALHWLSHTLSWQGQHEEAVSLARRAVEADPESKMMRTNLAYILTDARKFDEGLELARHMRETAPEYTIQHRSYYLHNLWAGRPDVAAAVFVTYVETIGGDGAAARRLGEIWVAYAERGEAGEVSGDIIAAARLGSDDLGQVLAFAGDAEGAIEALQVAVAEQSGSRSVFSMKINPAYNFIRDDPRFVSLLREVGLEE